MSWTRFEWEALLLDLLRQSEQIRPRGVKNRSARFFLHLVHSRVLALVGNAVSFQLSLQKKKPALVERGLELTEELQERHPLPGELPLIKDQGLIPTPQVAEEDFPEELSVQPARVRDAEVDDCPVLRDVSLEAESVACASLLRVHDSSMTVRRSRFNLEEKL